jgi:hypothetical protein
MKLAIMQPYFFPYAGYFDLIRQADRWIVFDTAQYIRHGWVNRNRILHPHSGWQYVIVPLKKHQRDTPINQVQISPGNDWKGKILRQLEHYRKKAPYYLETVSAVEKALNSSEQCLSRLNTTILEAVCRVLGIAFHYDYYSDMSLDIGPIDNPGDWALQIAGAIKATEYINPPGGAQIFDRQKFEEQGIKLTFQQYHSRLYETAPYNFVPDLSIIDVLMWNTPAEVLAHLAQQPGEED